MAELFSSTMECNVFAINIPSINEALSDMSAEILNASILSPKIRDTSISLEKIIKNSHSVDSSAQQEANALRQSTHSLELAIFEIQERMKSLEKVLYREAIIPATLSTTDDISVAFHIAVNSPQIDWPFADAVLERFDFLSTEKMVAVDYKCIDFIFPREVWQNNDFDSNMVKLFRDGDRWRLRQPVELILNIISNSYDLIVSIEFFDSLASILLQPVRSSEEEEEMKWAYLIVKNQDKANRFGIPQVINSFLYSRKGKSTITHHILDIISVLVDEGDSPEFNEIAFGLASNIPKALVKVLKEEIDNSDIIDVCLQLTHRVIMAYENNHMGSIIQDPNPLLASSGIFEPVVAITEKYTSDYRKIYVVLSILHGSISNGGNLEKFVAAGLLKALVNVFSSRNDHEDRLTDLVIWICFRNLGYIDRFLELGIPKGSSFFGGLEKITVYIGRQ